MVLKVGPLGGDQIMQFKPGFFIQNKCRWVRKQTLFVLDRSVMTSTNYLIHKRKIWYRSIGRHQNGLLGVTASAAYSLLHVVNCYWVIFNTCKRWIPSSPQYKMFWNSEAHHKSKTSVIKVIEGNLNTPDISNNTSGPSDQLQNHIMASLKTVWIF